MIKKNKFILDLRFAWTNEVFNLMFIKETIDIFNFLDRSVDN